MKNRLNDDIAFWHWARARQAKSGSSWSSYWDTQLTPQIEKQYYWWENTLAAGRSINITHKWSGVNYGTTFKIVKNTDAFYEIKNITHDELVGRYNGDKADGTLTNNNAYSVGDSADIDTLTFNGTDIVIRAYKGTAKGKGRFILFNGTLRGYLVVGTNGPNAVNADKAAGRYYVVMQAGNYSNVDASMGSLNKYDLIYYTGSAWQIYTQAQYTYIDVDFYFNGTTAVDSFTLFSGLAQSTYKMGILPLYEKNAASSGYAVSPHNGTSFTEKSFRVSGGTSINYGSVITQLIPSSPPHLHFAHNIEKYNAEQTPGWIPSHGGTGKMVYDGNDMQNWIDDVELTGNNVGDVGFAECSEYRLVNVSQAVNTANEAEFLMEVTAEFTVTVNGFNSKIGIETLIDTQVNTGYAVQLPWLYTVWNRFITSGRDEYTIPNNLETVNIASGQSRKNIAVYNATPGSDAENIIISYEIPDLAATYRGSTKQCFLYNMGSDIGKAYMPAVDNEVFAVGETWNTEIIIRAGYIADLISKIAAFVV